MKLGEILKSYRENNHLRTDQIVQYLGIDGEIYIQYENGELEPDYEVLEQLGNLYGVNVFELKTSDDGPLNTLLKYFDFRSRDDVNPNDLIEIAKFRKRTR